MPITDLKDFRHDRNLTKGKADQTEYIFFDTPGIPNGFVYSKHTINNYMCKLSYVNVNDVDGDISHTKMLHRFSYNGRCWDELHRDSQQHFIRVSIVSSSPRARHDNRRLVLRQR